MTAWREQSPSGSSPHGWIVGLETTADGGGAALLPVDGGESRRIDITSAKSGSKMILPSIEKLLREASARKEEIAGVGVALGPGAFTGMRVGLSTAKGIAYGLGCPLFGVSSIEAMAWAGLALWEKNGKEPPGWIAPVRAARYGEIFTALFGPRKCRAQYAPTNWPRAKADFLVHPAEFDIPREGSILFAGAKDEIPSDFDDCLLSHRGHFVEVRETVEFVARIALDALKRNENAAPPDLAPNYQRKPRAQTQWENPHA